MGMGRWILAGVLCVVLAAVSSAQDNSAQAMDEMMKAWTEAATPGEPHQVLAKMVGEWDTVTKSWMEPGAPPMESKGTCEISMVLGGRYMMQRYRGDMMGQPFEGLGYTGYDNVRKKYFSTWMDDVSTGLMVSIGDEDPETGKVVFTGSYWDPLTKGEKKAEQVMSEVGPDEYLFEMFEIAPGGEKVKSMEMVSTRKK